MAGSRLPVFEWRFPPACYLKVGALSPTAFLRRCFLEIWRETAHGRSLPSGARCAWRCWARDRADIEGNLPGTSAGLPGPARSEKGKIGKQLYAWTRRLFQKQGRPGAGLDLQSCG